jgi:hypothetical protein
MGLQTNGMKVITGRTVFYSMDIASVSCPHCRSGIDLRDDQDARKQLSASINAWYAGEDGNRQCWVCGRSVDLNNWQWDPPWASPILASSFGTSSSVN